MQVEYVAVHTPIDFDELTEQKRSEANWPWTVGSRKRA